MRKSRSRAHALPGEQTDLDEAKWNFEKGLSRADQMQLAHEVALAQGQELIKAYDNLVAVASGFRTRRARQHDEAGRQHAKPELHRTPCVGFIVRRKWRTAGRKGDPQTLPRHLLAFATVAGRRALCAVPTDVRTNADYGDPRPRGSTEELPYGVLVSRDQRSDSATGVATCAITRPAEPGATFVLSCRHVLSRTDLDVDTARSNLPVLLGTMARTPLGRSTSIRGPLESQPASSFDAQLMRVDNAAALIRARGGIAFDTPSSYLNSVGDITDGFWIATGRRGTDGNRLLVWVDFHDCVLDFVMSYPLVDGSSIPVKHDMVLRGISEEPLVDGDSGSPAIRVRRGQLLVGMYIGGDDRNAYVIPAWQLMTPSNYARPGEAGWALT